MSKRNRIQRHKSHRLMSIAVALGVTLISLLAGGCADCANSLKVRGLLVDAESGAVVAGAIIGGRTFTDGEEIGYAPPFILDETPLHPLSGAHGAFLIEFSTYLGACPAPEFPSPNQLEIIVIHDDCEEVFLIEVNEDTVDFIEEGEARILIDLSNPILLSPCEESP